MSTTIKHVCGRCHVCQKTKPKTIKYGKLPEKSADIIPWKTLCIDLIGPYNIGQGKHATQLHCLTMIDPATGWFEIVEITDKSAMEVASALELTWLQLYTWPTEIVMDRGCKFIGEVNSRLVR